MSSASLNKMTVPISQTGDSTTTDQMLLMPMLSYRFRVTFQNMGTVADTTQLTMQVIDVTRPKLSFDEVKLEVYNSRIYMPGKATWDPISLTVRDDAQGKISQIVGTQLQLQMDFNEQASAMAGNDYKFQTTIQVLDGGNGAFEPTVLETWELYGCYLSSVDYTSLSYATSDAVQVKMTIRFDNALQTPTASGPQVGVGQNVGRAFGDLVSGVSGGGTVSTQ